jgi:hypothetical protein
MNSPRTKRNAGANANSNAAANAHNALKKPTNSSQWDWDKSIKRSDQQFFASWDFMSATAMGVEMRLSTRRSSIINGMQGGRIAVKKGSQLQPMDSKADYYDQSLPLERNETNKLISPSSAMRDLGSGDKKISFRQKSPKKQLSNKQLLQAASFPIVPDLSLRPGAQRRSSSLKSLASARSSFMETNANGEGQINDGTTTAAAAGRGLQRSASLDYGSRMRLVNTEQYSISGANSGNGSVPAQSDEELMLEEMSKMAFALAQAE